MIKYKKKIHILNIPDLGLQNNPTLKIIYFFLLETCQLKPQDSFGRFVKIFLDLQKVDHIIRKHH